jgi:hypothetical protein
LNRPEYGFKDTLNSMLLTFVQTLHVLQPVKYPGFAFAWLQLVSSKFVIAPLLKNVNRFGSKENRTTKNTGFSTTL